VLVQTKDLAMAFGLTRDDTYFQYTTVRYTSMSMRDSPNNTLPQTGWMMWPYMINALAIGTRIVLYDGSPFHPTLERFLTFIADQGCVPPPLSICLLC
jgi:acetoacetyl-CoA synthetase